MWTLSGALPATAQQATAQSLPPREALAASDASMDHIKANLAQIDTLLKKANEQGGAEVIQCVREKRSSGRAAQDVAILARDGLREALASGSQGRADAELRKISVVEGRVEQITSEAMACLSEPADATTVVRDAVSPATTEPQVVGDQPENVDCPDCPSILVGIKEDPPPGTIFY